MPASYPALLEDVKSRIRAAQIKAALSVNRELIELYWDIGKLISARQDKEGWVKSVVERLSADLRNAFSQIAGFSPRNLWRMRSFYVAWTEKIRKLPQAVADLDSKMNFYLAAVDDLVRHPDDNPSIGLILCKEKNRIVVEFALKTSRHPVGVAEYKITNRLPKKYQAELPTPKELRQQLRKAAKLT